MEARDGWSPSAQEEREVRNFIRLRVACVDSYLGHCNRYVTEAIRRIVAICYKYRVPAEARSFSFGMNPLMKVEIEEVIKWLIEQLEGSIDELLELAVDDDNTDLLLWLDTRNADYDVNDGLVTYTGLLEEQLEAQIAGNMILGSSEDECDHNIIGDIHKPWSSDWWKAALLLKGADIVNDILRDGGITYGRGRSNVAATLLEQYGQMILEDGFGHARLEKYGDAKYFRSVVQDSNACEECITEDYRGWQPIDECPEGLTWHRNCRCHFYFK